MLFQADLWAESNGITPPLTKLFLEKHKHLFKWNKNESILEVGAGEGKCSKMCLHPILPKDYKEYLITDLSDEMLAYVRKNVELPNSEIAVLDVASQNIKPEYKGRFDHVFGFFLLHMLKNPRQALINIHKMLKPGGQTFLICFERIPVDEIFETLSKHPKWGKYGDMTSGHYYARSPQEEYKKDLAAAGFEVELFEIEDGHKYRFKDEQDRTNIYLAVNPNVSKIAEEELDEYKTCYLDLVRQCENLKFIEENGKMESEVNLTRLFVIIARKPL